MGTRLVLPFSPRLTLVGMHEDPTQLVVKWLKKFVGQNGDRRCQEPEVEITGDHCTEA